MYFYIMNDIFLGIYSGALPMTALGIDGKPLKLSEFLARPRSLKNVLTNVRCRWAWRTELFFFGLTDG